MKWITEIDLRQGAKGHTGKSFASITESRRNGKYIFFSAELRKALGITKCVKFGYDEEKNMFVVRPALEGALMQKVGAGENRGRLPLERFCKYCNICPELGRYPAKIKFDGEGGAEAWIDLNNKLD